MKNVKKKTNCARLILTFLISDSKRRIRSVYGGRYGPHSRGRNPGLPGQGEESCSVGRCH